MSFNLDHVLDHIQRASSSAAWNPGVRPLRLSRELARAATAPPASPARPSDSDSGNASPGGTAGARTVKPVCVSCPVMLQPLPNSGMLEKESRAESELELDRQKAQAERERAIAEAIQDEHHAIERAAAKSEVGNWSQNRAKQLADLPVDRERASQPFARPPQAYELYAAIDRRDIDYLMRVRDHAFSLLLQKNANEFPIVYAARWGPSHRDIVILLVGAFSRYVNQLEPDDFAKKETQNTLKALRANLKLAIDHSLLPTQSGYLLSSYLQVLIMSEGDAWVYKTTHDLGLVLRDPASKPVGEAEAMVRRFCTRELRGAPGGVAGVEEYIANAALDLVIMAAWSVAAGQMSVEIIPTYTFARDLRTYKLFSEAMHDNRNKLSRANRRIRSVLETLLERAGDSRKGVRGRLRDVQVALDGE